MHYFSHTVGNWKKDYLRIISRAVFQLDFAQINLKKKKSFQLVIELIGKIVSSIVSCCVAIYQFSNEKRDLKFGGFYIHSFD